MSEYLHWFSMDKDLRACEHPPVDLERAIAIVDEYHARGDRHFEQGEDAIAATMFGFSRSASDFIEFCVNGASQVSFRFEYANPSASRLKRMFGALFQFEAVLDSKAAMVERVREYFEQPSAAIKARLQAKR